MWTPKKGGKPYFTSCMEGLSSLWTLPAAVTSSSSTIIWKWHEYQIIFQCRYMYFPLLLWKYLLVLQDTICCWYNLMAWVTTMIQEGIKSPSKNKGGSTIISNTNLLSASKCGRRTLKTTTTNKREIDLDIEVGIVVCIFSLYNKHICFWLSTYSIINWIANPKLSRLVLVSSPISISEEFTFLQYFLPHIVHYVIC